MLNTQITLSTEERDFLVALLETTLKDTLIEEHRTRTLSFRERVLHNEDLIRGLLTKLGGPAEALATL